MKIRTRALIKKKITNVKPVSCLVIRHVLLSPIDRRRLPQQKRIMECPLSNTDKEGLKLK